MSGIDNAKKVAGWVHPNERAGCGNCKFANPEVGIFNHRPILRCGTLACITPRLAICNAWADGVGVRG